MITFILGYKTRVCDNNCRQNFKEDRQAGLNYGLHKVNGIIAMHREQWSLATLNCAYCGAHVNGVVPDHLQKKFNINRKGEPITPIPTTEGQTTQTHEEISNVE